MTLQLTPWGEFVHKYGAVVPRSLWDEIRRLTEAEMDSGSDWKLLLEQIAEGCHELGTKEALCEIIGMEEEESLAVAYE